MNAKKTAASVLSIIFTVMLLLFTFVPTVSAAEDYVWFIDTGCTTDGKTLDQQGIGMAVNLNGTDYIITDNYPDRAVSVCFYNEKVCEMKKCDSPLGINDGLGWFILTEKLFPVAPTISGNPNTTYNVGYVTLEYKLETGTISFDETEQRGQGYIVKSASSDIGQGYYPMIISDDDGRAVGYMPEEMTAILFEAPKSSSSRGSSDGKKSNDGEETFFEKYKFYIIGAAVAVVVGIVLSSKKKNTAPTNPSTPAPAPAPIPVPASAPIPAPAPSPIPSPGQMNNGGCCLQMDGGVMNGLIYPIQSNMLIGRNPECYVRFPADAQGVSRLHCKIFMNGDKLYVMDIGSSSGTFLKGFGQLQVNVPQVLHNGDVIYIGDKRNGIIIRL